MNEEKLNYQERRTLDLVEQLLNERSNLYNDKDNIADVFKYYNKIFENKTSSDFKSSMDNSYNVFKDFFQPDYIKNCKIEIEKLKNENSNSFLIIPVNAYGHIFAGVVRKINNDYSMTIVNKGSRNFNSQFKEYIFSHKKTADFISTTVSRLPVFFLYKMMDSISNKKFPLKISMRNQKVGNCFIKEPEAAIRYAFSTRNFNIDNFNKLRNGKLVFKPKWEFSISELHKDFIKLVSKENPGLKSILDEKLQVYISNKEFRNLIRNGNNELDSVKWAFDKKGEFSENNKEMIIELLKKINMDTVLQHPKKVEKLVNLTKDKGIIKTFNNLNYYLQVFRKHSTHLDIYEFIEKCSPYKLVNRLMGKNDVGDFFNKLSSSLDKGTVHFPYLTNQIKLEYAGAFSSLGVMGLYQYSNFEKAKEYFDRSIQLYPMDCQTFKYRGTCKYYLGNYKEGLKDVNLALSLKPKDPEMLNTKNNMKKLFEREGKITLGI